MRGRRCQRGVAAATCRSLWDHLGQSVRIKSTVNRSTSRVTLNQPIVQSSSIFRSSLLFLSPFSFSQFQISLQNEHASDTLSIFSRRLIKVFDLSTQFFSNLENTSFEKELKSQGIELNLKSNSKGRE